MLFSQSMFRFIHSHQVLLISKYLTFLIFLSPASPPTVTQVYTRRPRQLPPTAPLTDTPTLLVPEGNDTTEGNTSGPYLRRSSRTQVPPDKYGFLALLTSLYPFPIPTSYKQTANIPGKMQ